jgi:hypothetical protein
LGDGWSSPDGANWTKVAALEAFGARSGQAAVSFNGKLWVIGGNTPVGTTADVWSSSDGVSWTEAVTVAPFPPRSFHQAVVFNNQIWVFGGNRLNDVWYSSDGVSWFQAPNEPYSTGGYDNQDNLDFSCLVFNNQLWIIGGQYHWINGTDSYGNPVEELTGVIWSSPDGQNWNLVTKDPAFESRSSFASLVADGRMWVMGGQGTNAVLNDVWYTCDGTEWYKATASAGFSPRQGLSSALFSPSPGSSQSGSGNNLWVIGGMDLSGNNNGNAWYSPTGNDPACIVLPPTPTPTPISGLYANWVEATANAAFPPRSDHVSVAFKGQMWVIGGGNDTQFFNDTWSSSDGVSWTQQAVTTGFSPRIDMGAAIFNGQIWVVGGQNIDDSLNNDVWCSPDGVTWTEAVTQAPFSARTGLSLMVQDLGNGPELWVAGGIDTNDNVLGDVWASPDGVHWSQQGSFGGAQVYQVGISYPNENELVLLGGQDGNGNETNNIWTSNYPGNWNETSAPFGGRQDASGAVFDNLVFLAGGMSAEDTPLNDIWY